MQESEVKWELYEMFQALLQAPVYHLVFEGFLILWVTWLIFRKSYNPQEKTVLSEKEKDALIEEWTPEPLVPDVDKSHPALNPKIVSGRLGKYVQVDGLKCLNVATHNYLGMIENPRVEEASIKALRKYGVGSCGPRGFYGTIDVHLDLESKLAKFLSVEEAVLYSYGFVTVSSAIPAYSQRGDVIFVDRGVHFAIQKGLQASRSDVRFFNHNDMADLERLLKLQEDDDIKNPKKAKVTRRFLIVEGIYLNYGDVCPLPELVALKSKYKVRLFIDETVSFAVLGKSGKGAMEHFDISVDEADLITASLEYSIGSNGGFACGTSYVVDHQRLSGLGYCFSASLPPMLTVAALVALQIMQEDPSLLETLQRNCKLMHRKLTNVTQLRIGGDDISPVKHVYLSDPCELREVAVEKLEQIAEFGMKHGVAFVVARYLEEQESHLPPPSIRVTVNCMLTEEDIDTVANVLQEACAAVL